MLEIYIHSILLIYTSKLMAIDNSSLLPVLMMKCWRYIYTVFYSFTLASKLMAIDVFSLLPGLMIKFWR